MQQGLLNTNASLLMQVDIKVKTQSYHQKSPSFWIKSTQLRRRKRSHQTSKTIYSVLKRYHDSHWLFQEKIAHLESELSSYCTAFSDLDSLLQETTLRLSVADETIPVKEISKTRDGSGGTSSWLLYMWELNIEQLVNGTPPTSVNSNIMAMVKLFSPNTKIKELPSIWTIRELELFCWS